MLNVSGVAVTAYALLQFAVRARDAAFARSEGLLLHAASMAEMALDMLEALEQVSGPLGLDLKIRVGMDTGPVVAGVIGRHKFIYDLWGDTVNTASRMESQGLPGEIQVSEAIRLRLGDRSVFEDRGEIEVKGKGPRQAFLLRGRSPLAG